MKLWMMIPCAAVALGLAACVQVGPSGDKPLHIVMDVNIKIEVQKDVASLWDSVAGETPAEPEASTGAKSEENK